MDLKLNVRQEPPGGASPSWAAETLLEFMETRLPSGLVIDLELVGGGRVSGLLEGVDAGPGTAVHGVIEIATGGRREGVESQDIAAFTLREPPAGARDDELRG